jgi:excisionase family DNA binding protein
MEPLLVPMRSKTDKPTAAKALGCDRNKIRDLVYSGEIPSIKFGGRRVIATADLHAYVDRLRDEQKLASLEPPTSLTHHPFPLDGGSVVVPSTERKIHQGSHVEDSEPGPRRGRHSCRSPRVRYGHARSSCPARPDHDRTRV